MTPLRILIVEGHPVSERSKQPGAPTAPAQAYADTLTAIDPDVDCTIVDMTTADADLPSGVVPTDFDGFVWGGSALHLYDDTPVVRRQVAFAQHLMQTPRPGLASCWGLQVVTAAAGGEVIKNPNGVRFGASDPITLTDAGRSHAIHDGRNGPFGAAVAHADIVSKPPPDAYVLSSSAAVPVQSMAFERNGFSFFGMQYHPEFDFAQMAAIARIMSESLIAGGLADSPDHVERIAADWNACHDEPVDRKAAVAQSIDDSLLDAAARLMELRNWLTYCRTQTTARRNAG